MERDTLRLKAELKGESGRSISTQLSKFGRFRTFHARSTDYFVRVDLLNLAKITVHGSSDVGILKFHS